MGHTHTHTLFLYYFRAGTHIGSTEHSKADTNEIETKDTHVETRKIRTHDD